MDEPSPPTAAELGISDVEYERILRDVRQRQGVDGPDTEPASRRRASRRWPLALLALVLAVALVPRVAGGDGELEPAYAFMDTLEGEPVAYSSCRLVQVAVYPAGGPPDAEQLVREAVARMRTATGLDIVVAGVFGGHAPNWNFEAAPIHPDDPISVSWQDGDAIAELTDHTAGLGGSRIIESPTGTPYRVAGTIALSRDYYSLLTERGDHSEALAVLLHEFGHVFGLDHADSSRELMNADNTGLTTLGPGDLEGLRLLGRGPCV
ncbi:MAG: matrixin family metalloprotease [Nocardioides sp.]